jgi:hypothetical protein
MVKKRYFRPKWHVESEIENVRFLEEKWKMAISQKTTIWTKTEVIKKQAETSKNQAKTQTPNVPDSP